MTGALWDPDPPSPPAEGGSDTSDEVRPQFAPLTRWQGFPEVDAQRRHCGLPWCRCTHDAGCEFGWVDTGLASVRPCPTCRPDKAAHHHETRAQWLARLRKARR